MKSHPLFRAFEQIADAPGGLAKLRELLLQFAIKGRLLEQDPDDEQADLLFEQIQTKKQRLTSTRMGVARQRARPLASKEYPFEIPASWRWVRLGEVQAFTNGFAFRSQDYRPKGVRVVRIGDIQNGEISVADMNSVSAELFDELDPKFRVLPGDLLIAMSGATTGKLGFNKTTETFLLNQRVGKLELLVVNPRFAYFYLTTKVRQNLEASAGSAIPNLSTEQINDIPFPLPPLAEQRRIVAKVDELMALCDALEARQQAQLETRRRLHSSMLDHLLGARTPDHFAVHWSRLHTRFDALHDRPDAIPALRKAVFQLALEGRLIRQDPKDEPAEQLLAKVAQEKAALGRERIGKHWQFPPITEEAQPFAAPLGWRWARIIDAVERVTVGHVGSMKELYRPSGIPFLRSQNVRENRFDPEGLVYIDAGFHQILAKSALAPGDVVVVRSGNVGTACVIPETVAEANCSDLVVIKRPIAVLPSYLAYFMNSLARAHVTAGTVGVALTHFNTESVAGIPLPVPPLAEQQRIVARLEQLLGLCDALEVQLRTTEKRAEHLVSAAINNLLVTTS
jgi:type I restriction enzyme, S subunit